MFKNISKQNKSGRLANKNTGKRKTKIKETDGKKQKEKEN